MKKTLIAFTIIKENIQKNKHSKKRIKESIFGLSGIPPLNVARLKELAGMGGMDVIDCKPDLNDKLESIYNCDSKFRDPYASIEADPYSDCDLTDSHIDDCGGDMLSQDTLAHNALEPMDIDSGSLSDAENEIPMFSTPEGTSEEYHSAMECLNQLHRIIMNMKVSEYRKIYDNLKSMFEHI